jgi:O-methyltransferase involved in polyketide biosynthesis
MISIMGTEPELDGVPETALWTLHHRAREAEHPRTVLPDPMAIELRNKFDFPFEERFGAGFPAQSQTLALRARAFDDEIRRYLARRRHATVVALGEGFETTFWRVDNGAVQWLTVDLPETVALRRRLLPHGPRQRTHAGSALDTEWMDDVDPSRGVLITAQGLLMYLQPEQATGLIAACAGRFPGGTMVFDAITPLVNRQVVQHSGGYTPPPLHWFLRARELPQLRALHPAITRVREVRGRTGRGLPGWFAPRLHLIPFAGRDRPMVVALDFST